MMGFYEVMTADHSKWTSNLKGASQLLKEINFRWMAHFEWGRTVWWQIISLFVLFQVGNNLQIKIVI